MSRSRARRMVTSSPPSRMRPPVGSSRPAIMRSVVVLPQPDGPSMTKNSPSPTTKLESWTATNDPNSFLRLSTLISATASFRKFRDDDEHHRAGEHGDERVGVERQREGLEQHQEADADDRRRNILQRPAAKILRPGAAGCNGALGH